ncbi:MAG: hypothetical protein AM1032_000114 [Mycoplasmataceae bacterium]|nr:MAG: hypothetical protein AM1032_000114 [Mycoplasmataceae bacterium]
MNVILNEQKKKNEILIGLNGDILIGKLIINIYNIIPIYLNLINFNPIILTAFDISNNYKFDFNIKYFEKFFNLEMLFIHNTKIYGSLKHLKKLNNLKNISLHNVNVDPYFELLNDKVKICTFFYNYKEPAEDIFINKVIEKLKDKIFINKFNLLGESFSKDIWTIKIKKFKDNNYQLIKKSNRLIELEEIRYNLDINLNLLELREIKSSQFNKLLTNNDLFFLLFSKYGIFSRWLYSQTKYLKNYQYLYYQTLINMKKEVYLFENFDKLLDFHNENENNVDNDRNFSLGFKDENSNFLIYNINNKLLEKFNILTINDVRTQFIEEGLNLI